MNWMKWLIKFYPNKEETSKGVDKKDLKNKKKTRARQEQKRKGEIREILDDFREIFDLKIHDKPLFLLL